MRTTNGLERLNKEIKRRTRVATLFPNPESCLRLVSALLPEQNEEWVTKFAKGIVRNRSAAGSLLRGEVMAYPGFPA